MQRSMDDGPDDADVEEDVVQDFDMRTLDRDEFRDDEDGDDGDDDE